MQKIAKFALMSPFLTYAEVMPSKPGKDLCYKVLPQLLREAAQPDAVIEPPKKRAKTHDPFTDKAKTQNKLSHDQIKQLKASKQLSIGLKDVTRAITTYQQKGKAQ